MTKDIENKNTSLVDPVYSHLLNMILSTKLKPGDRIPEAKISAQFGISRTPIRDAIKKLANNGIITIYPNRYAEVAQYDDSLIKQIGVVRIMLDALAVKLAIHNGSNADFFTMVRLAEDCLSAAKTDEVDTRIRADCAFHLELTKIGKNQQLLELQQVMYLKIEFIQSSKYSKFASLGDPDTQFVEHTKIVNALVNRNEKDAIRLLTAHNAKFHEIENDFPKEFFFANLL